MTWAGMVTWPPWGTPKKLTTHPRDEKAVGDGLGEARKAGASLVGSRGRRYRAMGGQASRGSQGGAGRPCRTCCEARPRLRI